MRQPERKPLVHLEALVLNGGVHQGARVLRDLYSILPLMSHTRQAFCVPEYKHTNFIEDSLGRFRYYLQAVPGPFVLCPHSTGPKILDEVETFGESSNPRWNFGHKLQERRIPRKSSEGVVRKENLQFEHI